MGGAADSLGLALLPERRTRRGTTGLQPGRAGAVTCSSTTGGASETGAGGASPRPMHAVRSGPGLRNQLSAHANRPQQYTAYQSGSSIPPGSTLL